MKNTIVPDGNEVFTYSSDITLTLYLVVYNPKLHLF
ncbi:MAG: hypothetical protein BWY62_00705 [Firmicutes bacterium ADurb.Bin356]|nr:MAG: hypothetical protein BWY62_00705 [Firmicutes bacterium ADurb.Bin356]